MTKVITTPSQLREQGREAFALFGYYAHNPYVWIEDACACGNWDEGFAQAKWAATHQSGMLGELDA
jgi:hypothetical protein